MVDVAHPLKGIPVQIYPNLLAINAIMCKLQDEGLDTYNNLYIQTYGQDYIDEQINQLNNCKYYSLIIDKLPLFKILINLLSFEIFFKSFF